MNCRFALAICLLSTHLALLSPVLAQPDHSAGPASELDVTSTDEAWDLFRATMETVRTQSLSPAADQEFLRGAIIAMHNAAGQPLNRNAIAADVSAACTTDEMNRLFVSHLSQCSSSSSLKVATYAALNGGLARSAPGASFVSAREYRVQQQLRENQYVGIGIRVRQTDGRTVIDLPFIGGPAFKAGAREGDKIMEIDGVSTDGMTLYEVVQTLRGPKDSSVTVVVENVDGTPARTLKMNRHVVPLPTVKGTRQNPDESWEVLVDGHPDTAYLKIESIVGSTAAEFRKLMDQVRRSNARRLVVDLRDVPSAEWHHVLMLCDMIVSDQELARIHSATGVAVLKTRPESVVPGDLPIEVNVSPRVPGTVGLVAAAFRSLPNVTLAPRQIQSDGICYRSAELPEQLGAIENMPFAWCEPLVGNPRTGNGEWSESSLPAAAAKSGFPAWSIAGDRDSANQESSDDPVEHE